MPSAQLRQRTELAMAPGGLAASMFWLLKTITRVEIYGVFSATPPGCKIAFPANARFVQIDSSSAATLPPSVLESIGGQTRDGVQGSLAGGGRIYALLLDDTPACQLNITVASSIATIDTPSRLAVKLGTGASFLSFLFTHPPFRRRRLAEALVNLTIDSLANEGIPRCYCHVSMTNLPSLATFRRSGWVRIGWLFATTSGHFLGARVAQSVIRFEEAHTDR